jgi:hypothetical protein
MTGDPIQGKQLIFYQDSLEDRWIMKIVYWGPCQPVRCWIRTVWTLQGWEKHG